MTNSEPRGRVDAGRAVPGGVFDRLCWLMLLCFVASVPLEDIATLGSVGSLARLTGLGLFVVAGLAVCQGMRLRPLDATLFLYGGFVVWVGLSFYWSIDSGATFARFVTYLQLLLVAIVLWQKSGSERKVRGVLGAYVAGSAFGSAYTLAVQQPYHNGIERLSIGDSNTFGVELVVALAIAYYLLITTDSRAMRRLCGAFLVLGTVAVFETASRTALVTLVAAVAIASIDRGHLKGRRLVLSIVLVAGAAVMVLTVVGDAQLGRISSIQASTSDQALNGRTTQWEIAIDSFSRHPVTGVGAASFRKESESAIGLSRVAHNTFLGVAADLGVPGILIFVSMIGVAWRALPRLPRDTRRLWTMLGVVWLLAASSLTWEHHKITMFLVVMVAAHSASIREIAACESIPARRREAQPVPASRPRMA